MLSKITTEEIRDYLVKAIPHTWAVWDEAKKANPADDQKALWASGRLDGLTQILHVLDNDEFDRLSEEREKRINAVLGIEDADDED
ncbi:hypothetical protein AB0P16_11645 [Dietzia maris]|uniref:hypothetical protein n=1 Tax=Dietzia TaxID=37914 RepID=UPI000BDE86E8|nr:hypothetical protein [Dietzia sp. WMMA184]